MRRHSEIPNTPTPFSKTTNELKIGTILTIPNSGRAILRYVGPVQGKGGRFAGIELLGESAVLGKNSGDVNGIQYFKTSKPGAGLFMTYEKLLGSIDLIESSPSSNRLSLLNSPIGNTLSTTKNRRHTAIVTPSSISIQRSSVSKSALGRSNSLTPPSEYRGKDPPSSEELKRAIHAKVQLESEKNSLMHEAESLRYELEHIKSKIEYHEQTISDLELTRKQDKTKLEKANEKALILENKLQKQKFAAEEKRSELLDVIDQLESQITDNEKLYFSEMRKLQEEIKRKELGSTNDTNIDNTDNELLRSLKQELHEVKAERTKNVEMVSQLESKIREYESKLVEANKESLELKEAAISDSAKYEQELKEAYNKVTEIREDGEVKNRVIEKLRVEIKSLNQKVEDEASNDSSIEQFKKEIEILRDDLKKKEIEVSNNASLKEELEKLRTKVESDNGADKIYELEFKLENKESIIQNLQKQLSADREIDTKNKNTPEDTSKEYQNELIEKIANLKDEINRQKASQEEKDKSLSELENFKQEAESLKKQIKEKDFKILSQGKDLQSLKNSNPDQSKLSEALDNKNKELISIRETMHDLQVQLKELKLVEQKKSVIETERATLSDSLKEKKIEIATLQQKNEELEKQVKSKPDDTEFKSLLEEKELEIELFKEEILQLKSTDYAKEVDKMATEIITLKKLNQSTTNSELNNQLKILQEEMKRRPTEAQLQELRSELELIDELRKVEAKNKDKEIANLKKLLEKEKEKNKGKDSDNKRVSLSPKTPETIKDVKFKPSQIFPDSEKKDSNRTTMSNLSLNRPPVISQVVDGALQVYVPEVKDPANGRKLWCGLCEREGHDSIDCPYENDIF